MSYVYKFIDEYENIIYVGRTDDLHKRLTYQHFTKQGHLPKSCYDKCFCVETAEVKSTNESRIYEMYLMSKYRPEFNATYIDGGELTFDLPELNWVKRNVNKKEERQEPENTPEVAEVVELIRKFDEVIKPMLARIEVHASTLSDFDLLKKHKEKDQDRFMYLVTSIEKEVMVIREYKEYYQRKVYRNFSIYDKRTNKQAFK